MAVTGAASVLQAIRAQGGVYTLGHYLPIWAVVLIEFCLAYCLEVLMGSPASFKLASRVFDPRRNHPMIFESAIICATVGIMCPAMSFLAAFLYYPYYAGFHILTLLANWLKLVCFNFPFAFFTQLFFIQPLVRTVFKLVFRKDIAQREAEAKALAEKGQQLKARNENEAIADIFKRIDEIEADLRAERAEKANTNP
jgi:hypothetical protein